MGIETEYGISVPGRPDANPMILSGRLVQAYAAATGRRTTSARWDYADESPLADSRGFSVSRQSAHASQLTDEWGDDPTVANMVLTNGARLYVDHAHPEYSSPEVASPREALTWDRAGELVMARAAEAVANPPHGWQSRTPVALSLYKNNTDGKGASYGTHENYLVSRATPFEAIVDGLTPFFVARQILCGAGRVGIGQASHLDGYQIASRTDFFEAEVGLETTFRRPIINTRDEPHANPEKYRRHHVIIGDANLCDVAGLLKMGTTSLVLGTIEAGCAPRLALAEPLTALRDVSHDTSLRALVTLVDGRRMTGLEVLWAYHDAVEEWLEHGAGERDADTSELMTLWHDVLVDLGTDVMTRAADIDWIAKLRLLNGYRDRDGLAWSDPRLAAIDIQWSDLRPGKGLARRLEDAGRVRRLVTPEEVAAAEFAAPESTRAFFRGECVRRYTDQVVAASWESVILDLGDEALHRIGTVEPERGTRALVGDLLDRSATAADLVAELTQ